MRLRYKDQALEAYQEERDTVQKLVQRDQTNSDWQHDLAFSLLDFGDVLQAQSKPDQAMAAYQQAGDVLRKLVQQDPTNGRWQANLARAYLRLGETFQLKLQPVEARAALVRAEEILTPLRDDRRLGSEAKVWLEEAEKQLAAMK
jgi:tetratricopeptide (TPR) repeat protein